MELNNNRVSWDVDWFWFPILFNDKEEVVLLLYWFNQIEDDK